MKRDLLQQAYGAMRHDVRKTVLTLRQLHPTAALRARLEAKDVTLKDAPADRLGKFLTDHPDFDFHAADFDAELHYDVPGVRVGHTTIIAGGGPLRVGQGPVRTGVTAIHPHEGSAFEQMIPASIAVLNGAGEITGRSQVDGRRSRRSTARRSAAGSSLRWPATFACAARACRSASPNPASPVSQATARCD